jgi:hypothetical protein
MLLCKNCVVAALSAAAAAFVSANAQTQVQGVVQPADHTASQPVVHAVPLLPPGDASQPAPQAAPQPAQKSAEKAPEKSAEKLAHRPMHSHVSGPVHKAAPQPTVQLAPPILAAPTPQPYTQPRPTPQPYAQQAPAPQPYAQQPVPAPQPYAEPTPAPQPYAHLAPTPQPSAEPGAQPLVNWTLEVFRDGQQIDTFDGTTTVGQARTNQHHKVVIHNVGCKDQPAGSIDLQRTITVAPLRADPTGSVLAIEAQDTVESDTTRQTWEGCKLPPQPSQVHANHPGLVVPAGQWVNWQIVGQDPSLSYRVRANLAQP